MVVKLPEEYEKIPIGRTIIGNSPDYNKFKNVISHYMSNNHITKEIGIQTYDQIESNDLWERQFNRWWGWHWLRKRKENLNRFKINLCSKENITGMKRAFNVNSSMTVPKYIRDQFDTPESNYTLEKIKVPHKPIRNIVRTSKYKYRRYEPWLIERGSTSDSIATTIKIQPKKYHKSLQENMGELSRRLHKYKSNDIKNPFSGTKDLYLENDEKMRKNGENYLRKDSGDYQNDDIKNNKYEKIQKKYKNFGSTFCNKPENSLNSNRKIFDCNPFNTNRENVKEFDSLNKFYSNRDVIKNLSERLHNLENLTYKNNKSSKLKCKINHIRKLHKYLNKNIRCYTNKKNNKTNAKPENIKSVESPEKNDKDFDTILKPINVSDRNYIPASKFPWLHRSFHIKKEHEEFMKSFNKNKYNVSRTKTPVRDFFGNKSPRNKSEEETSKSEDTENEYLNRRKKEILGNKFKFRIQRGLITEMRSELSNEIKQQVTDEIKKKMSNKIDELTNQIRRELLNKIGGGISNDKKNNFETSGDEIDLNKISNEIERRLINEIGKELSNEINKNLLQIGNEREEESSKNESNSEIYKDNTSNYNLSFDDPVPNVYPFDPLKLINIKPINFDLDIKSKLEIESDFNLSPRTDFSPQTEIKTWNETKISFTDLNMGKTLLDLDSKFNQLFLNINQDSPKDAVEIPQVNKNEIYSKRYDINYITNNIQSFSSQISDLNFLYLNQ